MKTEHEFHMGNLIKAVFDKSGMSVAELARRIHCDRTNVYKIFARPTIDVELLVKVSKALQHNFFVDVMNLAGLAADIPVRHSLNFSIDDISLENIDKLSRFLASLKHPENGE